VEILTIEIEEHRGLFVLTVFFSNATTCSYELFFLIEVCLLQYPYISYTEHTY